MKHHLSAGASTEGPNEGPPTLAAAVTAAAAVAPAAVAAVAAAATAAAAARIDRLIPSPTPTPTSLRGGVRSKAELAPPEDMVDVMDKPPPRGVMEVELELELKLKMEVTAEVEAVDASTMREGGKGSTPTSRPVRGVVDVL